MKQEKIILGISEDELNTLIKRFHFEGTKLGILRSLSDSVLPLLQANAYYIISHKDEEISYEEYALCLVTLGEGFDELQELYVKRSCIEEAYMLECIGLFLLGRAYEELVKTIQINEGKWAQKIDFFGDNYPAEMMTDMIKRFDSIEISISKELLLTPKKSAFFMLPLSDKNEGSKPCEICNNCGNKDCMFRNQDKVSKMREEHSKLFLEKKNKSLERVSEIVNSKPQLMSYGMSRIFSGNIKK